jgi:hypothetical protein
MNQQLSGEAINAAINSFGKNNVITGAEQSENGINCSHAGSENVSAFAAFEFGNGALEGLAVGMIGARVIVAFIFANFFVDVGGGLVDGRDDGAGSGIGFLSYVDGIGGKTHGVLL